MFKVINRSIICLTATNFESFIFSMTCLALGEYVCCCRFHCYTFKSGIDCHLFPVLLLLFHEL